MGNIFFRIGGPLPSMDQWLREAKAEAQAGNIGMYLIHNGVVRKTSKAEVREGKQDAAKVTAMEFGCDRERLEEVIEEACKMEGIYFLRLWIGEGTLAVGDDIMYILLGGDTRPHVIAGLEALVGRIKKECVIEKELYEE